MKEKHNQTRRTTMNTNLNTYTLPADDRELLVQEIESARMRRAKRVEKIAQINARIHSATGDEARACYSKALQDAEAALASADRIELDAKARLERYFAPAANAFMPMARMFAL
jgi:vacuolar-type H+-ATPase subunit H